MPGKKRKYYKSDIFSTNSTDHEIEDRELDMDKEMYEILNTDVRRYKENENI